MDQVIQRYERYNAEGNRAIVFVTNDVDEAAAAVFRMALLPALNHFGIPYRIADVVGLAQAGGLGEAAAIVLAHDGVAASLTEESWRSIVSAAESGVGVVSFDGRLWKADPEVQRFFGADGGMQEALVEAVCIAEQDHYITDMQHPGHAHKLLRPVEASLPERTVSEAVPLAGNEAGQTLAAAISGGESGDGRLGERRAALYVSPALWLRQHFGHASGLDDLLWRMLIWAARKPFATLMMPPFVVCRVDDAIGSYDRFDYVRVLNEFNWIPNIGLFVDDIEDETAKRIKFYYDRGLAEFSAHSFHELGEPYPDQIYLQHDGQEYAFAELKDHFERLDRFYKRVGIAPSRTVNIHYDELGLNSLPFLLSRNQTFMMGLIPAGVRWYANSYSWEPYPYGHQGFNYGPLDPDHRFWNAVAHHLGSYKTPDTGMGVGEFLGGCTPFNGENDKADIGRAIERGVAALKLGVSSGFFGTLMTHEQRIMALAPDEWRAIIEGIHRGLEGWTLLYRTYDEISQYCKDKARTRIALADYDASAGRFSVRLEGTAEYGVSYHLYRDEGEKVASELVQAAPFAGQLLCVASASDADD